MVPTESTDINQKKSMHWTLSFINAPNICCLINRSYLVH